MLCAFSSRRVSLVCSLAHLQLSSWLAGWLVSSCCLGRLKPTTIGLSGRLVRSRQTDGQTDRLSLWVDISASQPQQLSALGRLFGPSKDELREEGSGSRLTASLAPEVDGGGGGRRQMFACYLRRLLSRHRSETSLFCVLAQLRQVQCSAVPTTTTIMKMTPEQTP